MMRMQTSGTATCKQAAEAFASHVEEGGELFGSGKWCEYEQALQGRRANVKSFGPALEYKVCKPYSPNAQFECYPLQ